MKESRVWRTSVVIRPKADRKRGDRYEETVRVVADDFLRAQVILGEYYDEHDRFALVEITAMKAEVDSVIV